ncbi:type II CAAX endopeptidase family protein [Desulfoluna sp.]|uniref:CPBP family intramembrane glutamic endopeptidase n=1 Tax=Desulfoluna sp. TaxID=2045199 RepID=UPI002609EC01|nr:type II CAAX endopeptidase family protein [Desulfoluna sp.]
MATKPQIKQSATALLGVLLMETAMRLLPPMAPPLASLLILRTLQLGVMALCLKKQFIEGGLGCLSPEALKRAFVKGVAWSLGFGAFAATCAVVLALSGINPLGLIRMRLPQDPTTLALFFLTGGLVAPIAEEFFFRGILYRLLRPFGMIQAILITTLLFAAAHAIQGGLPATQLVGGLLFAAAFEKEGHLLVPIIIHAAGNTALFTLSLI